jgi:RNA polymerase sigma-70 factor (ECF subfamily)
MITEGAQSLAEGWAAGPAGRYCLQAAIAYEHDVAPVAEATDWVRIAELYELLFALTPTTVVALNRAVAVSQADGPGPGLALLDGLGDDLAEYHYFHAARADLLRRLGRIDEAADAYRRALALAGTETEQRFLGQRLAELVAPN